VKRRNVFSTFHLIKLDQIEKSHLMGGGGGGDREREKKKTSNGKIFEQQNENLLT
jgi:hypothetical protein